MVSDYNRPVCKDLGCDVEITESEKYCAAHAWWMAKWMEKSQALLQKLKERANQ